MRRGMLLLALLVVSCFARAPNARYERRVEAIEREYARGVDEVETEYANAYDRLMKVVEDALVRTKKKHKTLPRHSVTESEDLRRIEDECDAISTELDELQSLGASTIDAEARFARCGEDWNNAHAKLLMTTYWAADVDWILKTVKRDPDSIQLEPLFVYSHNTRLRAYAETQLAGLKTSRRAAKRALTEQRRLATQLAAVERDEEIAANKRRFAAAMSAFAQGMASAQQGAAQRTTSTQPSYGTTTTATSSGCSSDHGCGYGYRCVKANYASTGYCAHSVNAYGVPTYQLPDMDSVFVKMPKGSDCKLVTDCPPGFACDTRSGACVR